MDSIGNFRELGGIEVPTGTIRSGVLMRSGHLAAMSDGDLGRLTATGLRTIVDLRSDGDIAGEGADRIPADVDHHRVPIHDDAGQGDHIRSLIMRGDLAEIRAEMGDGRGHRMALDGAAEFVRNEARMASFATAMSIVTDPANWPVLWHCSAGKDRAGWVGTAVLLAAGAARDVIVDHYLESNRETGTADLFPEGELKDLIRPFLGVRAEYVAAQLDVVESRWGGVDGLFREGFGLDDDHLTRFRTALIATSD